MSFVKIVKWLFIIVLFFASLYIGIVKLIPLSGMLENMARLGFGIWFTRIIGLCWVLGAFGLLFHRGVRQLALLGMNTILIGAIAAHLVVGDGASGILLAVLFLLFSTIIMILDGFYSKLLE